MPLIGLANSVSNTGALAASIIFDANALTFINAVGTLTSSEQVAVNNLVIGLKADSLWTSLAYIWPLVGNQNAQRYNLKNPSVGLITWSSASGSHSTATGFTPAAGEFGNTGVAGNTVSSMNHILGAYLRTASTNPTNHLMGSSPSAHYLLAKNGTQNAAIGSTTKANGTNATATGLFTVDRVNANLVLNKNGSSIGSVSTGAGSITADNLFLGAANNAGAVHEVSQGLSFGAFLWGNSLSSLQSQLYTRIQAFQTALSRQV